MKETKKINTAIVHRIYELSAIQEQQINGLVSDLFGIKKLPKIDFHYLLSISDEMLGYCAISKRLIEIDSEEIYVNLLGLFCIKQTFQRNGNGSKFLEFVKKDIYKINKYGIILNCGNKVQEFYKKNGFSKISENAKYIRNNKIEIDNDPVYYYGDQISLKNYSVVNLKEDF